VRDVQATAAALGLPDVGVTESPIEGADGNREFLVHLRPQPPPRTQDVTHG
jgi:predicted rRNA methylase YqxC with S4 and FtsJ domains